MSLSVLRTSVFIKNKMSNKTISGFSKLPKPEKVKWVAEQFFQNPAEATQELMRWWNADEEQQRTRGAVQDGDDGRQRLPDVQEIEIDRAWLGDGAVEGGHRGRNPKKAAAPARNCAWRNRSLIFVRST